MSGIYRNGGKKKSGKRISNAVLFAFVFIMFLLVFGGLCLWVIIQMNAERRSASASETSVVSQDGTEFSQSDARNLLIITTDDQSAQGFVLIRFDPANTRIRCLSIPRDTIVDKNSKETRLFELYASEGSAACSDALSSLLKIPVENFAAMSYPNIEKYVNLFEKGLIFTITEDLNYQNPSKNYSIKMSGGLRTLTGAQVVSILRYPSWNGGRLQRAKVQADFATAIINQYISPARTTVLQEDFNRLVNLSQSNLRASHFAESKAALQYLSNHNTDGQICSTIPASGEFVGNGDQIRFYFKVEENKDLDILFRNSKQN